MIQPIKTMIIMITMMIIMITALMTTTDEGDNISKSAAGAQGLLIMVMVVVRIS